MIVVTGAAGFIGSCLINKLNSERYYDIVIVDDFSDKRKNKNLIGKKYSEKIHRTQFFDWLKKNHLLVQFVFHIGARTDTAETNKSIFNELNLNYSKKIWYACIKYGIGLVYASSAATYGKGEHGYNDNHKLIDKLQPLNEYGISKNEFDKWALLQNKKPYFWAGLKFFNVYGPNEYHKDRMASVVFHAFNQMKKTGGIKLFKSHNSKYNDGKQMRDFIYIKDVINICYFFMHHRKDSGIYNAGTGNANTFLDLANNIFKSQDLTPVIDFIDTPADIRKNYQYFTQAVMNKLKNIGFTEKFYNLEDGIYDYVNNYLIKGRYL